MSDSNELPEDPEEISDDPEDLPEGAKRDKPRFRNVSQRRRVALAQYYGTGSEGEKSIEEIAEYLRVHPTTVEGYIHDSEMGDKVREMFPAAEERMKMDILVEKKERLEHLREMFRDKLSEKDIAVTGYTMETVSGHPDFEQVDGIKPPEEDIKSNTIRLDAPSPNQFEERTVFDEESRALLREIRKHENDIREMLSLDEPDEVRTEHHGDAMVEQKIYNFDGADDALPDAQVVDVESEVVDADEVGEGES